MAALILDSRSASVEGNNLPPPSPSYQTWYTEKQKADCKESTGIFCARKALVQAAEDAKVQSIIENTETNFPFWSHRHVQNLSANLAREIGHYATLRLKSHKIEVQH